MLWAIQKNQLKPTPTVSHVSLCLLHVWKAQLSTWQCPTDDKDEAEDLSYCKSSSGTFKLKILFYCLPWPNFITSWKKYAVIVKLGSGKACCCSLTVFFMTIFGPRPMSLSFLPTHQKVEGSIQLLQSTCQNVSVQDTEPNMSTYNGLKMCVL